MKLPNGENAFIDIDKLVEYCLNPAHPRGRHKARVFASACGITAENADVLRWALLEAAREGDATPGRSDRHGERYVIDWKVAGPNGEAGIRSGWIVRSGEDFPRLTTCYVL